MKPSTPRSRKPAQPAANQPTQAATAAPSRLHPNNPHHGRYDLAALAAAVPALQGFFITTPAGDTSIDFSNAKAVLCLNQALLKQFYGIAHWSLPQGFLCPPIPGRADYVHHAADLLQLPYQRPVNAPQVIRVLDIGTGANLIYPIIATRALGWQVVGSDISSAAIANANKIIAANANLAGTEVRLHADASKTFSGVIQAGEYFDLTLCNPPFFKSADEANKQAARKWRNLKGAKASSVRNFGGQQAELWCDGGEWAFLRRLITESGLYAAQVGWFTSLVSNQDHLPKLQALLRQLKASEVKIVPMAQGQKRSHLLAWRF
ncbi:23S rRNA (adenine(1618)-N(6))-methyltransferase RlmF [Vitreoscilla massiliensis]|uniref:Ribosomal RNA large subunit methyltransferase F n=1 Tax=Vitreoscilla massiliensis TaxID=1689272 RepID=A0ABY4DWL7_9NEIS|nr:23S rRNA (adenine(1618)-N(6))-methyltransferase RlmF [Vitreoscilla massiliensis]UOO87911.1 23S rRNA (adenine(1618)-N(6))-methyltransferase RlmF [Vitreoscilla massiliensis]